MMCEVTDSVRRVCPGHTTRYAPAQDDPSRWIARELPEGYSLAGFQGFAVDRAGNITRLLVRTEFEPCDGICTERLLDQVRSSRSWAAASAVAERMSVDVDIVLVPSGFPHQHPRRHVVWLSDALGADGAEARHLDIAQVEQRIRALRGYSFDRRPKGLDAACTRLECYLANRDDNGQGWNPWPGDLDGVLVADGVPVALLEYKTHNLDSPIANERIGKYGAQDWRRFKVLFDLQDSLGGVPILFVVWGPRHDEVKVDVIRTRNTVDESVLLPKSGSHLVEWALVRI